MLLSVSGVILHTTHLWLLLKIQVPGPSTLIEIALIKFHKDFCLVKHNYHLTVHQHLPQLPAHPLDMHFILEFVKGLHSTSHQQLNLFACFPSSENLLLLTSIPYNPPWRYGTIIPLFLSYLEYLLLEYFISIWDYLSSIHFILSWKSIMCK